MNIRPSGNAARPDAAFSHVTSDGSARSIFQSFYSIEYSRIGELARAPMAHQPCVSGAKRSSRSRKSPHEKREQGSSADRAHVYEMGTEKSPIFRASQVRGSTTGTTRSTAEFSAKEDLPFSRPSLSATFPLSSIFSFSLSLLFSSVFFICECLC